MKQTSVQIGKAFEKEAYQYLQTKYDNVIWLSKQNWLSEVDFECYKNKKKYYIDAKTNYHNCIKINKKVNLFITKNKNNKIIIIQPLKTDYSNLNSSKIQINIPDEINKKLKIYRIKNDYKNLAQAILFILEKKLKIIS
jgi:hypothetical protein